MKQEVTYITVCIPNDINSLKRSPDSSTGIATAYEEGSIPGKDKRYVSIPHHPDRLWGPFLDFKLVGE
jgi:hypothetical protein